MLVNYWGLLVSSKELLQSGVLFRWIKNVWRKNLGKCAIYIGIKVIPTGIKVIPTLAFSLSPVLIQSR